MKYFLDTEFLEGTQKTFFGKSKPTIDLISIGIVSEDGREYYAISKDFNLKEAWNRYDLKETSPAKKYMGFYEEKVYWIRENVLKPIFSELIRKDDNIEGSIVEINGKDYSEYYFNYSSLKRLILKYGKTNKQISEEVKEFCKEIPRTKVGKHIGIGDTNDLNKITTDRYHGEDIYLDRSKPEFYGYYCDYDWVAFCWMFGKMIDLPKGFPMYCRDLKQILDEKINSGCKAIVRSNSDGFSEREYFVGDQYGTTFDKMLKHIKDVKGYQKQDNAHNALDDAKWNMELYKFFKTS